MKKILFIFAFVGWTLGTFVHILTFFDIDASAQTPFVWLLFVGIFVVWLPTILELKKNEAFKSFGKTSINNQINPFETLKITKSIFQSTPKWLKILALSGWIYTILNSVLFFTSIQGTPDFKDGQYFLHNHGNLIRIITEKEYTHLKVLTFREISCSLIFFYGIALAILYPFNKNN